MKLSAKALTLAEMLLASAILAFTLAGLLMLWTRCILLNNANRNLAQAVSHAQYVLEGIRHSPFSGLLSEINNGNWDWDSGRINSNGLSVLDSEAIDTQASGSDPLQVIVSVTWLDRQQRSRSASLATLITDYQ